jgi:S-adenosylmethionine-diacylglycerol 3-amino-3-carboxypropyl transferase
VSAGPAPVDVSTRADFSRIRYAQCWEDADVLLEGLAVRPGETCLSIGSAGDNSLSLLTCDPARVISIDLSAPQIACLELRVAAYRALEHGELLELVGSRPSDRRQALYARCRAGLSPTAREFWDRQPGAIAGGIGAAGKFERYFSLFRRWVLPLVHGRRRVARLLRGGTPAARRAFFEQEWDTARWRLMFRLFFSRQMLGRFGRDPAFFRYVHGDVADAILARTRYAITELNPAENPYIQWILTGRHETALPHALRPENFAPIRDRLDRLEWHRLPLEGFLDSCPGASIARFNLSDIFEYMSIDQYQHLLERLLRVGCRGGRLVYWNLLAERRRPESLANRLRPLEEVSQQLHARDKAFFYSALIVEEIA